MTKKPYEIRTCGGREMRRGYYVSHHVVAERWCRPDYTLTIVPDGRAFASVRTLLNATVIAAQVEATRPTFNASGVLTAAAAKRLTPFAYKVWSVA